MPTYVPEDSKHAVTVTSTDSSIAGDNVTIRYYQKKRDSPIGAKDTVDENTVVEGDTVTGVQQGDDMTFLTDFASTPIDPGTWYWQLIHDDNGTQRGLALDNDLDGETPIRVTDAPGI